MNRIEWIIDIGTYAWIAMWYAAIWITQFSLQLFLTGLFTLFITLVNFQTWKKQKAKKKKAQDTAKSVKELRKDWWKKALKEAKGNEEKAWLLYGKRVFAETIRESSA